MNNHKLKNQLLKSQKEEFKRKIHIRNLPQYLQNLFKIGQLKDNLNDNNFRILMKKFLLKVIRTSWRFCRDKWRRKKLPANHNQKDLFINQFKSRLWNKMKKFNLLNAQKDVEENLM